MTDAVNEQLSACLDGELPRGELDLLLKRVERDIALGEPMSRYALIGEALRDNKPVVASRPFATKLTQALQREPALSRPWAVRIPPAVVRRLRPVAGMAIAAGVAAVAVLSVQQAGVPSQTQTIAVNQTQGEPAGEPAPAAMAGIENDSYTVPSSTSMSPLIPGIRLTNYVVAHSEYSSPLGRRSVLTGVLAEDDTERAPTQFENVDVVEPSPQEH